MEEPKSAIYTILSGIAGATTYQARAGVTRDMPCFIYQVTGNTPTYTLGKEIGYQEVEVTVDIYAETSKESGSLLATLVDTMISSDYRMVYCSDVSDDNLSHITTVFNLVGY